jgi:hypothetical protein
MTVATSSRRLRYIDVVIQEYFQPVIYGVLPRTIGRFGKLLTGDLWLLPESEENLKSGYIILHADEFGSEDESISVHPQISLVRSSYVNIRISLSQLSATKRYAAVTL